MYKATFDDLRVAGKAAREHMKKHGFRHVVYAYITKDDPEAICIMDWDMMCFETDADFNFWLRDIKADAEMVYAVHAM